MPHSVAGVRDLSVNIPRKSYEFLPLKFSAFPYSMQTLLKYMIVKGKLTLLLICACLVFTMCM